MKELQRLLRAHIGPIDWRFVWPPAVILMGVALLIACFSGTPYLTLRHLFPLGFPFPFWVMAVLWLAWYGLIGGAWGLLFAYHRRHMLWMAWLYRGSTYLVLGLCFSFVWYFLLFGAYSVFFSWCMLLIALALVIGTCLCWFRLSRLVGVVVALYGGWLTFLILFQVSVFLK